MYIYLFSYLSIFLLSYISIYLLFCLNFYLYIIFAIYLSYYIFYYLSIWLSALEFLLRQQQVPVDIYMNTFTKETLSEGTYITLLYGFNKLVYFEILHTFKIMFRHIKFWILKKILSNCVSLLLSAHFLYGIVFLYYVLTIVRFFFTLVSPKVKNQMSPTEKRK